MFSRVLYVSWRGGTPSGISSVLFSLWPQREETLKSLIPSPPTPAPLPSLPLPSPSFLSVHPSWLLCTSSPFSFFHSSPRPLPRQVHLSSSLTRPPILTESFILHPLVSPPFSSPSRPSQKMLNSYALARKPSDSHHTPTSVKTFTFLWSF